MPRSLSTWKTLSGERVVWSLRTGFIFDPLEIGLFPNAEFLPSPSGPETGEIKASRKEHGVSFFMADLTKLGHAVESICQSSRPVSIRYSGSIPVVRSCKPKLIYHYLSDITRRKGTRNARILEDSGLVTSRNLDVILHKCNCPLADSVLRQKSITCSYVRQDFNFRLGNVLHVASL